MHLFARFITLAIFVITLPSLATAKAPSLPAIRVLSPVLSRALADLCAASPTARAIVDELVHSDLVIHVVPLGPARRGQFTGATHFVVRAGGRRLIRVAVDQMLPHDHRAAALAHELYHALEVARTGWVVDHPSFAALFRRIGRPSGGDPHGECFETVAAVRVTAAVLRELRVAADRLRRNRRWAAAATR